MLQRVIGFSLKNPAMVLFAALLMTLFAVYQLPKMPVDVFPELNAPTVVILTEAGGPVADEVERYVSFPIETAVNGWPGTRRVRSAGAIGLSLVWVEFNWGEDLHRARQMVSERLSAVRDSPPPDVHAEFTPVTSITGEIMLLALPSPEASMSELELRAFAKFDLRNRLPAIPGVAQVVAIGGSLPEYQINVHQDRLALYDLTIQDVIEASRGAHSTASAGYLANVERLDLPVRQTARVQGVSDIANAIVKYHLGTPVLIGQVADVVLGPAPKRGTAADRANPAVVLSIQKAPGTNTLVMTEQIDKVLDEITKSLPQGMRLNKDVFRQARFIQRSVDNVVRVLKEATVIVAVIWILFLLNVRTTFITLTALPLSLAATLLIIRWYGLSINVMTLGGLAVAIGVLVDDAIIDVEYAFRRLKQNAALPESQRKPFVPTIFDASNEIRSAMVFATIIIVVALVPLLFLQRLEGRFFRPLGITYIVSILASLVVALTVTPALCKLLLHVKGKQKESEADHDPQTEHADGFLVRRLKRRYEPSLRRSIRHRATVLSAAVVVTVLAIAFPSRPTRANAPSIARTPAASPRPTRDRASSFILMTALCAALGLIPLALSAGGPGSELLAPLAIVVLGGLISSTLLNLIVVPAAYSLVFGAKLSSAEGQTEAWRGRLAATLHRRSHAKGVWDERFDDDRTFGHARPSIGLQGTLGTAAGGIWTVAGALAGEES